MTEDLPDLLNFEEEAPHADERWLMSYADMMTLLFGFFVMLYSMMHKMDVVQKSAADKFKPTGIEVEQNLPEAAAPVMVKEAEHVAMVSKMAALITALADEKGHFSELQKSAEKMEQRLALANQSLTQLNAIKQERDQLRAQVAKNSIPTSSPTTPTIDRQKEADPAPKGLSGGGNRGARERQSGNGGVRLRLSVVSADGSFSTSTMGVTNKGFGLEQTPPVSLGETFEARVTGLDGRTITVVLRPNRSDDGGRLNTAAILHYIQGDERVLKEWIANAPP